VRTEERSGGGVSIPAVRYVHHFLFSWVTGMIPFLYFYGGSNTNKQGQATLTVPPISTSLCSPDYYYPHVLKEVVPVATRIFPLSVITIFLVVTVLLTTAFVSYADEIVRPPGDISSPDVFSRVEGAGSSDTNGGAELRRRVIPRGWRITVFPADMP